MLSIAKRQKQQIKREVMSVETTFRSDVRLIIIRRFAHVVRANVYAAFLRDSGIDCFISNSNTGTLIPFVEGGYPFLLHIAETDKEEVIQLLDEMDRKASTRADMDFRDADISDIAYEKSITEYENRINKGSGRYFVWGLLLLALGVACYIAYKNGVRYQKERTPSGYLYPFVSPVTVTAYRPTSG